MNPQVDNASGLGLPQPDSDMSQLPPIHAPPTFHPPQADVAGLSAGTSQKPESILGLNPLSQASSNPTSTSRSAKPLASNSPADPLASVTAQFVSSDSSMAIQADDTDSVLDEEWVDKAKEIVTRTRTDPYLQSKELNKLRVQYMKARYNKDIKIGED